MKANGKKKYKRAVIENAAKLSTRLCYIQDSLFQLEKSEREKGK